MKNLWEDIYGFLKREGLDCTCRDMQGNKVIYVSVPGKGVRAVLPMDISAESQEEASRLADMAAESIRAIVEQDPEGQTFRPVIITEDRWRSQQKMMKARLLAHLEVFDQIYARNCEVRKIDKKTAGEFLAANHSYGEAACRYRYGLFLKRHTGHVAAGGVETVKYPKDTLGAVATFSNARKWIKGDKTIRSYEWTRYASLPGIRLSGGMGKLLKAFIKDIQPDDIMTYADLEWSEGKVYESLGFVLEGVKAPVGFYIDKENWKRIAIAEGTMTGVDMPLPARGRERLGKWSSGPLQRAATVGSTGVNGGHVPSALYYFQNFGSNKYRLKLTEY
ncbi:MAG: hypothetical protein IJV84_03200 [Bacteroidales bacterium]|nr:hypothetical protein [Bacteroidales bacterium]